ncbi:MAG: restriction endonuclease subunit S [Nostocaceae cyanobacterium]|nr:restriction endonuclease subunit S [Nostocaceae cyanobacterium]
MTDISALFDFSTIRLSFIADVIDPQPDHRAPALADRKGYPYVGIRDINPDGSINIETARKVELEAVKKQEQSFKLISGDIVFCKVGTLGSPKRIQPIPQIALSATLVLIKPKPIVDSQFLYYALDSNPVINQCQIEATGSTRQALGIQQIRRFDVPFVSLDKQKNIATFLDRKTAAIDALIAKKQRLIELLEEKRTSLINHAVTKGLNPNVEMKDSGVPWIGEIPKHWGVTRLGFLSTNIQTGPFGSQLHASDYIENGIPVVNPINLQNRNIVADYQKTVNQEMAIQLNRHKLLIGDLVFARRGELGRCEVVDKNSNGWLCGTGCIRVRINKRKADPDYLNLFISIPWVSSWLSLQSVGSTIDNLNTEIISMLPIILPPKEEQIEILRHIELKKYLFDKLIITIDRQIEKLQEYRQSLITAAVTGKININEEEIA